MNVETSKRIFAACIEDIKKTLEDCTFVGFPAIVEIDKEELEDYEKQESGSELFDCIYVNQGSCGMSGDSFEGYIAYPFEGNQFFQVYYTV